MAEQKAEDLKYREEVFIKELRGEKTGGPLSSYTDNGIGLAAGLGRAGYFRDASINAPNFVLRMFFDLCFTVQMMEIKRFKKQRGLSDG